MRSNGCCGCLVVLAFLLVLAMVAAGQVINALVLGGR